MQTQIIGWVASIVLLATIGSQIRRQWASGSSEGVSRWLFIGQVTASSLFVLYSWLVRDWVFIVTNSMMLLSALTGLGVVLMHRRRERSA